MAAMITCYSLSNMTTYFNIVNNYKYGNKTRLFRLLYFAVGFYQNSLHLCGASQFETIGRFSMTETVSKWSSKYDGQFKT